MQDLRLLVEECMRDVGGQNICQEINNIKRVVDEIEAKREIN